MAPLTTGRFDTRELLVEWVLGLRHIGPRTSFAKISAICGVSRQTARNIVTDAGDNWRDFVTGDFHE